jgi:hypothetical protein
MFLPGTSKYSQKSPKDPDHVSSEALFAGQNRDDDEDEFFRPQRPVTRQKPRKTPEIDPDTFDVDAYIKQSAESTKGGLFD